MRKFLIVTLVLALVLGLTGLASARNWAYIEQVGNPGDKIYVEQKGTGNFIGQVYRWGFGDPEANLQLRSSVYPAYQYANLFCNKLWIVQHGSSNDIGLYEWAQGYNDAWILQTGSDNLLLAWQKTTYGHNELNVTQTGVGRTAHVLQYSTGDHNEAKVYQH